jgi:REP element-mobilizing transposase RayT
MPDHLHLILTTAGDKSPATRGLDNSGSQQRVGGDSSPPPEGNISQIMHAIKGRSARLINKKLGESGQFWQKDFYEHGIRNEKDFEEKLNYIHLNLVRANLAKDPADFKYSSYRNYYLGGDSIIKIDRIEL